MRFSRVFVKPNIMEHMNHFILHFPQNRNSIEVHSIDASSKRTRKRQKVIQRKELENMKINQSFFLVYRKKLCMMCVCAHHHFGATFSERFLKKTYRILKIRNECNKCITNTHTFTHTAQSTHCTICHAIKKFVFMRGDELQPLDIYKCISLVNVQFCFEIKKSCIPAVVATTMWSK